MKYAVLFQGQGRYDTSFVRDLYKTDIKIKQLFEKADEVLGFSVSDLILNTNNAGELDTDLAQILIFVMEYAIYQSFLLKLPQKPVALAGHSLGEITALSASGCIRFEDALKLVQHRGIFMKTNPMNSNEGMMAIRNISRNEINLLCNEVMKNTDYCVVCANYNSTDQTVISGHFEAMEIVKQKIGDEKCRYLSVKGAFHSPLMVNAANKLNEYMKTITFHPQQIPVISSVTGEPYVASWSIRDMLTKQMVSPVRWVETINSLSQNGISIFAQVTNSKLFSSLDKSLPSTRIWTSIKELCEEDRYDFDKLYHSSKRNFSYKSAVISDVLSHMIAYPWKNEADENNIKYSYECYSRIMKEYIDLNDNNKEPEKKQIIDAIEILNNVLHYKDIDSLSIKEISNGILEKYGLETMRS